MPALITVPLMIAPLVPVLVSFLATRRFYRSWGVVTFHAGLALLYASTVAFLLYDLSSGPPSRHPEVFYIWTATLVAFILSSMLSAVFYFAMRVSGRTVGQGNAARPPNSAPHTYDY